MYNSQYINFARSTSTRRIQFARSTVRRGALVVTSDGRMGFVQFVRVSPYWVEEKQGIKRAYIYSLPEAIENSWTDYVLLSDLKVLS